MKGKEKREKKENERKNRILNNIKFFKFIIII